MRSAPFPSSPFHACCLCLAISGAAAGLGCGSSGAAPGGGGSGGGAPSCAGYPAATTEYTPAQTVFDHFPAHIQGKIDPAAPAVYTISLPEGADVSLVAHLGFDAGFRLASITPGASYEAETDTQLREIPQQIFAPGDHQLEIAYAGKFAGGSYDYEVTIQAYDSVARRCDASYADPYANASDSTATPECDSYFERINSPEGCFGLMFADDATTRQRLCGSVTAPCQRAAREVLSCLAEKGTCPTDLTDPYNITLRSPDCTPRSAACD